MATHRQPRCLTGPDFVGIHPTGLGDDAYAYVISGIVPMRMKSEYSHSLCVR